MIKRHTVEEEELLRRYILSEEDRATLTAAPIVGSDPRTSCALNTTGDRKPFPKARLPDVILAGPFMTEAELAQAIH